MNGLDKDVVIDDKWLILSKIGEGSFGQVFKAKDIRSDSFYAIKREPIDMDYPQLHHEHKIYNVLQDGPCIPKCHWFGQYDGYHCMMIDLLGSSLKDLQQTVKDIPLDIVIDLGCQLVSCLEYIHDRGLVYRDIKPENFLFSSSCVIPELQNWSSSYSYSPPPSPPSCRTILNNWGKETSLYVIDFGLATWWRNPKTNKPYPESKKPIKYKTGTARYASLNVHMGRNHARRDDMESVGYLILDLLLSGELPWSGVTARSCKAGWDQLKSIKQETSMEDLCLGLPQGIMNFIDYTRRLRFTDRPDYDYLRRLLRGCVEQGPFSKLVTPYRNSKPIPHQKRYHPSHRRTSVHVQQKLVSQQEDVFVMDDLVRELPSPPKRKYRHHSSSSHHQHRYYHYNKHSGWNNNKFPHGNSPP